MTAPRQNGPRQNRPRHNGPRHNGLWQNVARRIERFLGGVREQASQLGTTWPTARPGPSTTPALAAGFAVILTATAFSGVLQGLGWLVQAALAVAIVVLTGIGLRAVSWPAPFVALGQLSALLLLLTASYTTSGILVVLPGPDAVADLVGVFHRAVEQIHSGSQPITPALPLTGLIASGIALVALLVDVVVTALAVPAVSGLVLLCVFAVPASLADQMLPWWSFVLGATGFATLLIVDGERRRRSAWGSATGGAGDTAGGMSQQAAAIGALSAVAALLAGTVFTGVGTAGRLPGRSSENGIGLKPFASLRGQLNQTAPTELFRVRGLSEPAYLRAMTLRNFDPQKGWSVEGLTQGVPARGPVPLPDGANDPPPGPRERVQIRATNYQDPWLPTFGVPTGVRPQGDGWRYDTGSGILFNQNSRNAGTYTEDVVLPKPSPRQLQAASGPINIDPAYLDHSGTDPRITRLADDITARSTTSFDKAVALNRFLANPANGFRYSLNTGPANTGDALSDFLLRNRQGYCEQYASAMAMLLREVHIPSRVAVGFTAGHHEGDERVITTQDAHAWVEAYFPGTGWTTFDPTPLTDGRGIVPPYMAGKLPPPPKPPPAQPAQPTQPTGPQPTQPPNNANPEAARWENSGTPQPTGEGSSAGPVLAVVGLLVALAAASTPYGVRALRRRRRLERVVSGTTGAASDAWDEIRDECADRGLAPNGCETVRAAGERLADELELDESGRAAMRELVAAVEHAWYAPSGAATTTAVEAPVAGALRTVLDSAALAAPLSLREQAFPRSVLRRA